MPLFNVEVNVNFPGLNEAITLVRWMVMTLDELKTKVEANTAIGTSAITLLQGLAQLIRDSANDPQKIQDIANMVDADTQALADAIQANTPTP